MLTRDAILATIISQKHQIEKFGVTDLGLFGSYARNQQSPHSDIDLLIDFRRGHETFDNLMAASDLLQGLFPGKQVQIVTKKGLSPYIGPHILKEVVYV